MTLKETLLSKNITDPNIYRVRTMADILGEVGIDISDAPMEIVVVTGPWGILHEEIQDEVKSILHGDFYILPSSIYEVLCVAKSDLHDPKVLKEIVMSVNAGVVDKKDQLSDDVFEIRESEVVSV